MAPVCVVWEGDVCESGMTVVTKHGRRHNFAAVRLPLHAWEIRRLDHRIYVWYLFHQISVSNHPWHAESPVAFFRGDLHAARSLDPSGLLLWETQSFKQNHRCMTGN